MGNRNCWLNTEIACFDGVGQYDIPEIAPLHDLPTINTWTRFNYALSKYAKKTPEAVGINFWVDDYQFERIWTYPLRYTEYLKRFSVVCMPDFSMFADYPKALSIYNHYRNCWLGAYWQKQGLNVIPCPGWIDEDSYDWCFDGMPQHSIVAVNAVGTQRSWINNEMFTQGYEEMLKRLQPTKVLMFSKHEMDFSGPVEYIPYERWQDGKLPLL